MLVPLRHFKYMSVSSNESDMRAQAMTFKAKTKV